MVCVRCIWATRPWKLMNKVRGMEQVAAAES
jgi:hypothetical protein